MEDEQLEQDQGPRETMEQRFTLARAELMHSSGRFIDAIHEYCDLLTGPVAEERNLVRGYTAKRILEISAASLALAQTSFKMEPASLWDQGLTRACKGAMLDSLSDQDLEEDLHRRATMAPGGSE